jgi:hypothetical protein
MSDQASSFQELSVEKKLRRYLNTRVLVLRNAKIGAYRTTFDPGGRLLAENEVELKRNLNAILFIELRLDTEHLMILGEAVEARRGTPQATLRRNAQRFNLVTCTIIPDVPLYELTFPHAIGLLCRIFLTREEFASASLGQKSPAH